MFLAGAGLSIVTASVINLLVLTVDRRDMGLAYSINTVFRTLGTSIDAPVAGSMLTTYTTWSFGEYFHNVPILFPLPSSVTFHHTFYIAAIVSLLVAFLLLFAEEVMSKRTKTTNVRALMHAGSDEEHSTSQNIALPKGDKIVYIVI